MTLPVSVVILAKDAAATLGATLASVATLSDDVHVVDSGSSDATLEIARAAGARISAHPFESYGAQRNWAIENLPLRHPWELHLDADERVSPALDAALRTLFADGPPAGVDGYAIPRLVHFLGRPIRHGGMYPIWHLRLFRRGRGRCERRRYDQHFYLDGPTGRIDAPMIDDIRLPLAEWTARHNRWSEAAVAEMLDPTAEGVIDPTRDDPIARRRALRGRYERLPPFLRPLLLFLYRYLWRGGFRDGVPGLIFFVLQTFWFHFLIDAKLWERRRGERTPP
ncbi:MAG: glycosyltransferase family 2 protein [Alphaproteobacteria bacterium]